MQMNPWVILAVKIALLAGYALLERWFGKTNKVQASSLLEWLEDLILSFVKKK